MISWRSEWRRPGVRAGVGVAAALALWPAPAAQAARPELLSTPDGPPRSVVSDGRTHHVLLSASGRFAALMSDAPDLARADPGSGVRPGPTDVFLRDRRTRSTMLLSQGLRREGREFALTAMSADGRSVLLVSNARMGESQRRFLRDVRTGTLRRMPPGMAYDLSPDGRHVSRVVGQRPFPGGRRRPVVLVRDLRRRRTVAIRRGLARGEYVEATRLSRGGRFVAYASTRGRPGAGRYIRTVWRADTRTGAVRILDRRRTAPETFSFGGLDMSSNGRFVAFSVAIVRRGVPVSRALCVCAFRADARGGRRVLLSRTGRGPVHGTSPSMSGDGRRVAFTAASLGPAERPTTIGVRDVGRRAAVLVPRRPNDSVGDPALSADGRTLAFVTDASDVRRRAGVRELGDEESDPQAYAVRLPRRR